jgi:hypothetical protein
MNNRILLFTKTWKLSPVNIKLIQALKQKDYETVLISPAPIEKTTADDLHRILSHKQLINIGSYDKIAELRQFGSTNKLKNYVTNRLEHFKDNPHHPEKNVLSVFLLDSESEDLYSSAVRTLIPNAPRILVYGNENSVAAHQEKLALKKLEFDSTKTDNFDFNKHLSNFWNTETLTGIKNSLPDPLEDDNFNQELVSMYRSDAVLFHPEIVPKKFLSYKKMFEEQKLDNFNEFVVTGQL